MVSETKTINSSSKKKKICFLVLGIILLMVFFSQEIFFYVIPFSCGRHPACMLSGEDDDDGLGYIYPLEHVDPNDNSEYAFAYYFDGDQKALYWVCDNSEFIKANRNGIIIYNSELMYNTSTGGGFYIYKDGKLLKAYMHIHIAHTIIYNKPFEDHIKVLEMNYDEFADYCAGRGWEIL